MSIWNCDYPKTDYHYSGVRSVSSPTNFGIRLRQLPAMKQHESWSKFFYNNDYNLIIKIIILDYNNDYCCIFNFPYLKYMYISLFAAQALGDMNMLSTQFTQF